MTSEEIVEGALLVSLIAILVIVMIYA